jgi:Tripartite tricarboxylate transporter TctB family
MSSLEQASSASSDDPEVVVSPRTDFLSAIGWMGLGIAILIGSVMMDRLEDQDINPYTIPGLLPGLLGIAMIILGALLAIRSWRAHPFRPAETAVTSADGVGRKRLALVLTLCLAFGVGLVGHGLPFWFAVFIFVTASILTLQYQQQSAIESSARLRQFAMAAAIGLGAGIAITVIFQDIFLVRLP